GQKRTGRQRDTIPRRGQGDCLALEVGIGSDLRPGDQAVDRICRLHAYRHGIRAIQHGIDEKPAIGGRHVGTATALYRGLVAFQGSLRITVGSRDRILDHVNADTRLREKVLLLRDNERQAPEALGVRGGPSRPLRRRSGPPPACAKKSFCCAKMNGRRARPSASAWRNAGISAAVAIWLAAPRAVTIASTTRSTDAAVLTLILASSLGDRLA